MKDEECIDSATGQETQLAVLGTTERVLYTVQSIRNVLHYDALQKEPELYGSVWKLRETGEIHRPELDGIRRNTVEHTGDYVYHTGPGSVNPYSYPCRHVRASDLWCRRRRDVIASKSRKYLMSQTFMALTILLGSCLLTYFFDNLAFTMSLYTYNCTLSCFTLCTYSFL